MGVLRDLENLILPIDKLNADGIPTASLAILEDGKISAHVITNSRENTDTVYQAASISKSITALAVAKLVDQGRISYDTKVVEHLRQSTIDCITDDKTNHLLSEVTVGMLVSHTSGLSQHGFLGYAGEAPFAEDVLAGRYPSNSPKVHFLSFPGAVCAYSGGGYTLLQLFLENVMEMSFPEIMQQIVLKPLDMTRSWYGDLPSDEQNFTNGYRTAFTEGGRHKFAELAAAGLWTTPTDLLKAISAIQESLNGTRGFLSQQTARKMSTQVPDSDPGDNMSLGWGANDRVFGHSGGNEPGYNTYFFGFHGRHVNVEDSAEQHASKNGLAIMINSALGHDVAIRQVVNAVFYLKGWQRVEEMPFLYDSINEFVPYAAPEGTTITEDWMEWIGKWEDDWEIIDEDGPALAFRSFKAMRLRPAASPPGEASPAKPVFIFVVDGLKLGVRLTWEEHSRVVQLMQDEPKMLKRKKEEAASSSMTADLVRALTQ